MFQRVDAIFGPLAKARLSGNLMAGFFFATISQDLLNACDDDLYRALPVHFPLHDLVQFEDHSSYLKDNWKLTRKITTPLLPLPFP